MAERRLRGAREEVADNAAPGIVLTIVAAIGLVFVANWAAAAHLDAHTTNRGYWLIGAKWSLLARQRRPVDVLVLGDSTCNQGLNNAVLNRALDTTSLNLCTTGRGTALDDLWMLREYVGRVGRPKQVLVIHALDVWARTIQPETLARIPRATLAWTQQEISLAPGEVVRYLVARYVRLYSEETTLRAMLTGRGPRGRHFRLDPHGFMRAHAGSARRVLGDARRLLRGLGDHARALSASNYRALGEMSRIARDNDFDLIVLNGPIHESIVTQPKGRRRAERVTSTVARAARGLDAIRYCPKLLGFPASEMSNADHLSVEGSVRYTQAIAKVVAKQRAGRRNPCASLRIDQTKAADRVTRP